MDDSAQPKRRRPGCFALLLASAILIAASVGAVTFWSRVQLNQTRALYEARGYPTSLAALDASYKAVPPDQNAALGFLAAWKARVVNEDTDENLLPVLCSKESCKTIDVGNPVTLGEAEALLAKNAEALKFAHVAAKLQASRYPGNLAEWPLMLDHYGKVSTVARLLLLEAAVHTHKGDTSRATEAFEAVYACARSLAPEPLAMSLLSLSSIQSTVNSHVATALGVAPFKDVELDRILTAARGVNDAASLDRAISGDAVFGLYSDSPANPLARTTGSYDRAEYARLIEALLDAAELPLSGALREYEQVAQSTPGAVARITKPIAVTMAEPLAGVCRSDAIRRIRHELFETVIAVEKFRLKHGALPMEATELVPEFLRELRPDPYGDAAYLYLLQEKGYKVWSFGRDRSPNEPNIQLTVGR